MKFLQSTNQENLFNEVVFQQRNKAYGAFVLRSQETHLLNKSLLLGLAFVGVLSSLPILVNLFKTKEIVNPDFPGSHGVRQIHQIDETEKPTQQKAIEKTTVVEVSPIIVPKKNLTKEVTLDQIKMIGNPTNNVVGNENGSIEGNTDGTGKPGISEPVVNEVKPIKQTVIILDEPMVKVDVEAEFPGGVNVFRNQISKNFDVSPFEGTDEMIKATVNFIVEKDGTISQLKVKGNDAVFNKEAERTIKAVKTKWKPAKLDGKEVRSYFSFPISMKFE